jgi:integrase/recombinase XerD
LCLRPAFFFLQYLDSGLICHCESALQQFPVEVIIHWLKPTNLYQDGTELVSRILGHSSTETTRIYAVPSVDMMRKVMESGNLESDERPLWTDDEAEMARICGLR